MSMASIDFIIAEVNPAWQWMRVVCLLGGIVFLGLYSRLAWLRRKDRSVQANIVLAVSAVLILNSLITSTVIRWDEDISFRLPVNFICVTVGLVALLQPPSRWARNRKAGDLL